MSFVTSFSNLFHLGRGKQVVLLISLKTVKLNEYFTVADPDPVHPDPEIGGGGVRGGGGAV